MCASAFAAPILFCRASVPQQYPQLISRRVNRRILCPSYHCCLPSPQQPFSTQVTSIEAHFRSLGADDAAQLVSTASYSSATCDESLSQWKDVLDVFATYGIKGSTLSSLTRRLGVWTILGLDAERVKATLVCLTDYLVLGEAHRNRVALHRPDIFNCEQPVGRAVHALERTGLRLRDISRVILRWPGLLVLKEARINRVVAFLCSYMVGFSGQYLKSLLRRAPWVFVYDIDTEMAPAVFFLREILTLSDSVPVDHYIRACPLLLGTPRWTMRNVVTFLVLQVGLSNEAMISVVKSFPPILTCSVERDLKPVSQYLTKELNLDALRLAKAVRAFPALLTLDVESDIRVVVDFFNSQGIRNIARIVSRLPPILGYDLETNIIPKMRYIENELGLSSFDILQFPGYFSYSLTRCIEPRTKFLLALGTSVPQAGLNLILSLTDEGFCSRIAKCPVSQYYAFRKAYFARKLKREKPLKTGMSTAGPLLLERGENTKKASDVVSVAAQPWERAMPTVKRRRRSKTNLSRMPWKELR